MDNTMVSARVPRAKKERAGSVLASIGATTSDLINSALDYVIQEKQLPKARRDDVADEAGFATFVEASTLDVDWSKGDMADHEGFMRRERMADHEGFMQRERLVDYKEFMRRERMADYESLA